MGYLDADGYLFICDRKHDMVISGGVNVYPLEVEHVLAAHADVVDVAVIGVPDPRWGEALLAVVERRAASPLTAAALQAWTRDRVADYKVPRRVEFVDELPRDPNGKVLKRFLRERFATPA
jgi:acyl-CoA synthetase (AMP-forming)/AMP-acid ligase II